MKVNIRFSIGFLFFLFTLVSIISSPFAIGETNKDELINKLNKAVSEKKYDIVAETAKQLEELSKTSENPVDEKNNKTKGLQDKTVNFGAEEIKNNVNENAWYAIKPEFRFFQPKLRVYFDTGEDDENEVDLFNDGTLSPTINLLEVYWPFKFNEHIGHDKWRWGPSLGGGISAPAGDSEDNTKQASDAPVVLLTAGLLVKFPFSEGEKSRSVDFEAGYAMGFSTDEEFDNINDGAVYVGVGFGLW